MLAFLHHAKDRNARCAKPDERRPEDGAPTERITQEDFREERIVDERDGAERREDHDRKRVQLENRREDIRRDEDGEPDQPQRSAVRRPLLDER